VFAAAVELDVTGRAALLAAMCSGRPDVRAEAESLLRSHDDSNGFLGSLAADFDIAADRRVGTQIGAYRLLERIGAGGMGTVYRAERADGDFTHRIAIKIIAAHGADSESSRRFRAERQILAALQHPNIVTLFDAGFTTDGHAYLAMEYVEGMPLAAYCREQRLPLADRIDLVRRVCDAVQYLHQHAVVHRDLKPANILVTPEGIPKVLDFGIAKLLTQDTSVEGVTRDAPVMTPNYASPEQVRGLPATVASDVYALGIILYEVLTGTRPYETEGKVLDEVLDVVAHLDVRQPSGAAPRDSGPPYALSVLRGDLDAVVLRALRKAPPERYASAAALADDLGRYREGLPVEARPPSLGYVLSKLARRHKVAFLATGAGAAVIVALIGVSLWQASVARAQRARAERQLADVRRLAETLIFKVHDAVAPLPGSTPVRKMLVSEGLAYLERMQAESSGKEDLQLEIARAYLRIGTVQGQPNTANLGDPSGAIASFLKAEALLTVAAAAPTASAAVVRSYVDTTTSLSDTLANMPGRQSDAAAAAARGARVAERFVSLHPRDEDARDCIATASFAAARVADHGDELRYWLRSRDEFASLLADHPTDANRQRQVALIEKYIGGYYDKQQEDDAALEHYQRAMALDEPRATRDPTDRMAAFDLAIDLSNLGYVHDGRREFAEATRLYERSLAIRERLSASDPSDVLARLKVAFMLRQMGFVAEHEGDTVAAIRHFRRAAELYGTTDPGNLESRRNLAISLANLATLEQKDRAAVCADASRAFALFANLNDAERRGAEPSDPMPDVARTAVSCGAVAARAWLDTHAAAAVVSK
jgi:non-specific serine/threonine protein kinase/serine/threonine-protein kinase